MRSRNTDSWTPHTSWFVPLNGPQAGQTLLLPKVTFILGRGPTDCAIDLIVEDEALAPEHVVFRREFNELVAYDAQLMKRTGFSRRGLRDKVHPLFRLLRDNSHFLVGRTYFVYRTVDPRAEPKGSALVGGA